MDEADTEAQVAGAGGEGIRPVLERDPILLNSREVARLLDLSPDQVNEFARKQILPAFKAGRQWRFRKKDIASFKRHFRGATAA